MSLDPHAMPGTARRLTAHDCATGTPAIARMLNAAILLTPVFVAVFAWAWEPDAVGRMRCMVEGLKMMVLVFGSALIVQALAQSAIEWARPANRACRG